MKLLALALASLPVALAAFEHNHVYRSPYANAHLRGLAVDVKAVEKRAVRSYAHAKRQAANTSATPQQVTAPSGVPDTYLWKGDYPVADWDDASYIYSGKINYSHR